MPHRYWQWLMHSLMVLVLVGLGAVAVGLGWVQFGYARVDPVSSSPISLETGLPGALPKSQTGLLSLNNWVTVAKPELVAGQASAIGPHPYRWVAGTAVPVLMYHYIRTNPDPSDMIGYGLSVTPADFNQQMAYLAGHGYQSLSVAEVAELWRQHKPLPAHPVVITFDDGYDDLYRDAYPTLKQYGLRGETYIISGKVNSGGYVSWSMLREMVASGVMVVGSHTVNHPHLTTLSPAAVVTELVQSKRQLEQELGVKATDFCYPFGDYNQQVTAAAVQAGYRTATTTAMGWWQAGDAFMTISRVRVEGGESLATFAARLHPY